MLYLSCGILQHIATIQQLFTQVNSATLKIECFYIGGSKEFGSKKKDGLFQQQPANGHERGVHLIRRTLVIGDLGSCRCVEVTQHMIEGSESTDPIPIVNRMNPAIKLGRAAAHDG